MGDQKTPKSSAKCVTHIMTLVEDSCKLGRQNNNNGRFPPSYCFKTMRQIKRHKSHESGWNSRIPARHWFILLFSSNIYDSLISFQFFIFSRILRSFTICQSFQNVYSYSSCYKSKKQMNLYCYNINVICVLCRLLPGLSLFKLGQIAARKENQNQDSIFSKNLRKWEK